MRKSLFSLVAVVLFVLPDVAKGQVLTDSVRMDLKLYYYQYRSGPDDAFYNCGAGIYATWPDVAEQVVGAPTSYNFYSRVATEGQYIPTGFGETLSNNQLNIVVPNGHFGHFPALGTGRQGFNYDDCGEFLTYPLTLLGGGQSVLNGAPFRISEWYAVFSVPSGTPIAEFEWDQPRGLDIAFDATDSREKEILGDKPVVKYEWEFGDGQTGLGAAPTHTYTQIGTYSVLLTVTDDDGETNSIARAVKVRGGVLLYNPTLSKNDLVAGEEFTLMFDVRNTGTAGLTDLSFTVNVDSSAGGSAIMESGPIPAQVSSLAAGSAVDIVYNFKAVSSGEVSFLTAVLGKRLSGESVLGRQACFVGPGKQLTPDCGNITAQITNSVTVNSTGDLPLDPALDPATSGCSTGPNNKVDRDGVVGAEAECTLRAAIKIANAQEMKDRIDFNIPPDDTGCTGVCLITPDTALPTILTKINIDGRSQPGADIELDGAAAGPTPAFRIEANDVDVIALTISRFDRFGIEIYGGSGHAIKDSKIGIRKENKANVLGGIFISQGATDITIGGPETEDGNQIDGGIRVDGAGTKSVKILGNEIIGREDGFGITINGGSEHEIADNDIRIYEDETISAVGGILIKDAVTDVTIGGLEEEDENIIGGGIRVDGSNTRRISILRNQIELPEIWTSIRPLRAPIDMSGDGPSCTAWNGFNDTKPNRGVPSPRILKLKSGFLSGISRAGATVVAYRVVEPGDLIGRYWARSVEAIGVGEADDEGEYQIGFDAALSPGAQVVVSMSDADGNSSELSQVKRPVIFIPGVGGSWLEAANGDNLFIPTTATDFELNARLGRLAMNTDGTRSLSGEEVFADGVLEQPKLPYRPVLQHLQDAGFPGTFDNSIEATLDLWRFAYDWRRDPSAIAGQLEDLIDHITNNGEDDVAAASCQVDITTHSNGGMVASSYVFRDQQKHSRIHVNRLFMSAAPYLGTPQVIAAHTKGYLFDIEKSIPGTDLDWAGLITVFQNLPDGYGLLPSKNYWEASGTLSGQGLMPDLNGNELTTYDEVFSFMTSPKRPPDPQKRPGLARNGAMWAQQQTDLHNKMNDWSQYNGPPQVFRHIGNKPESTNTGWYLENDYQNASVENSLRRAIGDTELHVQYREGLSRFLGPGDGTVSLLSATLGGGIDENSGFSVGIEDYSGQNSTWIEPFEYYPCLHVEMVSADCPEDEGPVALDRMVDIIKSSYEVLPVRSGKGSNSLSSATARGEALYVEASARVRVSIVDAGGARTGPIEGGSENIVQYDIEGIGYWPRRRGAVLSLDSEKAYSVTIEAIEGEAVVGLTRRQAGGGQVLNVLFEDKVLAEGGQLRLSYLEGGTDASAVFDADTDGNGTFESTLEPAVEMTSTQAGPSIPRPEPRIVQADVGIGASDPVQEIQLPGVGGPAWTWTLEKAPVWFLPDVATGQIASTVTATLAASTLSAGVHRDTLVFAFTYESFTTRTSVPIVLAIRNEAAVLSKIVVQPKNRAVAPGDSLQFWALGEDQLGLPIAVAPSWSATGGTISQAGMFVAGATQGAFTVTASTAAGTVTGSTQVEIATITAIDVDGELPTALTLHPNYPNPFNPTTVIPFALPQSETVSLVIYDILGRRVATLVDSVMPAGRFEVTFDASNRPSGMYLYRLTAGNEVRTGRMVLLK